MDVLVVVALAIVAAIAVAALLRTRRRSSAGDPSGGSPAGSPVSISTEPTVAGGAQPVAPGGSDAIARALREAMSSGQGTASFTHVEVVDQGNRVIHARDVPGLRDAVLRARSDHGIDVTDASGPAPPASPTPADRVELLENLEELRGAGALTDAELEAARRRLSADS